MDVEDGRADPAPAAHTQPAQPEVFGSGKLYDLDDSVRVWSDFMRLHLHPRSVALITEYQHNQYVLLQETQSVEILQPRFCSGWMNCKKGQIVLFPCQIFFVRPESDVVM